jgi:hypothetical protein
LTLPWSAGAADDPYWERFINNPPCDLQNMVTDLLAKAPEGMINPAREETHTPEVTSSHIKQLAQRLTADLVGVARLDASGPDDLPFAVICVVRAEHDPDTALGVGGQVPRQNGLFITFVMSAYIRELGFRATAKDPTDAVALAVRAGLGTRDADARLRTPRFGTRVHVVNPIRTDLPLAADG